MSWSYAILLWCSSVGHNNDYAVNFVFICNDLIYQSFLSGAGSSGHSALCERLTVVHNYITSDFLASNPGRSVQCLEIKALSSNYTLVKIRVTQSQCRMVKCFGLNNGVSRFCVEGRWCYVDFIFCLYSTEKASSEFR